MRNKAFLIIIFISHTIPLLSASYRTGMYRNINYFSVSGGIGYGTLLENIPDLNTHGSLGGFLSFGYELRVSNFWLNTGIECQYIRSSSSFNISGFDRNVYDTQGKQILYHYDFDKSIDTQQFAYANIPLLMGWHYVGFYIGAGAKIGYCISATENSKLQYSTTGTYFQYIEDFSKMDDHYYSTYNVSTTEKLNNKIKVSLVGEVGYDFLAWARQANNTEHHGLKVGAYIEYGLNNIISSPTEKPLYTINDANASILTITPFYNARSINAYRVIPLFAGIRISWIFCIRTKHCDCNVGENRRAFFKRYNNILH